MSLITYIGQGVPGFPPFLTKAGGNTSISYIVAAANESRSMESNALLMHHKP